MDSRRSRVQSRAWEGIVLGGAKEGESSNGLPCF